MTQLPAEYQAGGSLGVVVRRSDPVRLASYRVPRIRPMKVLDLLLVIQRDIDPTLAFRVFLPGGDVRDVHGAGERAGSAGV